MSLLRCLDTAFAALGLSFVSRILVLRTEKLTDKQCAATMCHVWASLRLVRRSYRPRLISDSIGVGCVKDENDEHDIAMLVEYWTLLGSCQKDTSWQPI